MDAATTSRFSTLLRGHHDDLVKRRTATVTSGLRGRLSETELDLSQPAASWSASPAWATSAPGWPGRPAAGP